VGEVDVDRQPRIRRLTLYDLGVARPEQLEDAQRKVALAMGACLALSWAPIVGGVLSGLAQAKLVKSLLVTLGRDPTEESVETLMWFYNKRTLYIGLATYAPTLGPAIAMVLTYALGQLVIRCATDDAIDLTNEAELLSRWEEIEKDIFSGGAVITSYEHFSGRKLPPKMRPRIERAIDWMSKAYRRAERLPGVTASQNALGNAIHRGAVAVGSRVKKVRVRFKK
jgi:hypothetical protein